MKYHVFNKKPRRQDIEEAMQYSDPEEQMEALIQSMTQRKVNCDKTSIRVECLLSEATQCRFKVRRWRLLTLTITALL